MNADPSPKHHSRLRPLTRTGVRQLIKTHHPVDDPIDRPRLLAERFGELGPIALTFLDGLLAKQIQGKLQAQQLLALIGQYQRDDMGAAFDRVVRFGAFSLAAKRVPERSANKRGDRSGAQASGANLQPGR